MNSHLREAADILCGMFFDAKFAEEDVQTERGVILEEIGMYADDPADLVMERMSAVIYKGSALARPILGKKSTLEKMSGTWLREYKRTHYLPDRVVVSLAGSFEDSFVEELKERFSGMEPGQLGKSKAVVYHPALTLKRKATEQEPSAAGVPLDLRCGPPAVCHAAAVLHPGGRHVFPALPGGPGAPGTVL